MLTLSLNRQSRLRFAAAAIAIALIPTAALLPSVAYARINGPVGDTFSAGCLMLQNKGDALIAEYKNATNARREEILQELRNNGRDWINIGCRAVFGDISRMVILPKHNFDVGGRNMSPPASLSDGNSDPGPGPAASVPSFL